jgi:hypothetical protein
MLFESRVFGKTMPSPNHDGSAQRVTTWIDRHGP